MLIISDHCNINNNNINYINIKKLYIEYSSYISTILNKRKNIKLLVIYTNIIDNVNSVLNVKHIIIIPNYHINFESYLYKFINSEKLLIISHVVSDHIKQNKNLLILPECKYKKSLDISKYTMTSE